MISLLIHGTFDFTTSLAVGIHWCITDINFSSQAVHIRSTSPFNSSSQSTSSRSSLALSKSACSYLHIVLWDLLLGLIAPQLCVTLKLMQLWSEVPNRGATQHCLSCWGWERKTRSISVWFPVAETWVGSATTWVSISELQKLVNLVIMGSPELC